MGSRLPMLDPHVRVYPLALSATLAGRDLFGDTVRIHFPGSATLSTTDTGESGFVVHAPMQTGAEVGNRSRRQAGRRRPREQGRSANPRQKARWWQLRLTEKDLGLVLTVYGTVFSVLGVFVVTAFDAKLTRLMGLSASLLA